MIYLVLDNPFPLDLNRWARQAYQREYIFKGLTNTDKDDYVMFSDPDEIPNPALLKNFNLQKKFAIFLQKHFVYKFNIANNYEYPWPGTRICKLKNLKSFDYMRQKILIKNIKKWWRIDKEKSIEVINNGGWHFNNLFSAEEMSIKLKTFAHEHSPSWLLILTPSIVVMAIPVAYYLFIKNKDVLKKLVSKDEPEAHFIYNFLLNKWYFDELYNFIFVEPLKKIGLFFWRKGDINTIDRYGPDGLSRLIKIISDKAVNFQSGYLYHYAFVMLIGFSILLTYLILN